MEKKAWTDWADFLVNAPPGTVADLDWKSVRRLKHENMPSHPLSNTSYLLCPKLLLHCNSPECQGLHWYETEQREIRLCPDNFLVYTCRHCQKTQKTFAVFVRGAGDTARVGKIGEYPPFGPHTPARLVSLIGPDKETYFKGRRAESQGLGIGAFAYYRRVVESQKIRLFDAIIKIAQEENTDAGIVAQLERAKLETQFTKAIDEIKPGIPEALKIGGQNPLTLLHSALSEGLHAETDEECLAIAEAIRKVLALFAERLEQVRKDRAEIKEAVAALQKKAQAKVQPEFKSHF